MKRCRAALEVSEPGPWEDYTMIATRFPTDLSDLPNQADPALPCFLNGTDGDADDPCDWWLDLGAIDLTRVPGM